MNRKPTALSLFVRLGVSMAVTLVLLRTYQFFLLRHTHTVPQDFAILEFAGFFYDLFAWLAVSLVLILPYKLLIRRWPLAGKIMVLSAGIIFLVFESALFNYFMETLTLLDQVVFSYTIREMVMITRSSVPIDVFTLLPLFVFPLFFFMLASWNYRTTKWLGRLVLILCLASPVILAAGNYIFLKYLDPPRYYIIVNKTTFFVAKCATWKVKCEVTPEHDALKSAAERYHDAQPEFDYTGYQYPFMHDDDTPDVLAPFFSMGPEKPNIVLIIVESLSTCFMGNNPYFGNFTPFLDSLSQHSLCWNNFLSTSDRTFNVLPALLGSLPPGDPSIMEDIKHLPYHLSLIRVLSENGYTTSFFYGGDPAFNNMEGFLRYQGTDFISKGTWRHEMGIASDHKVNGWGCTDSELFQQSFPTIDSVAKSPRLDIYLTLSLHSPFIPPNQDHYLQEVARRRQAFDPKPLFYEDSEKYSDIFATVLYTDDALRQYFNTCRKRADFKNTIFIITGDHGLPELNLFRISPLHRFNVPLLIYSPMLKTSTLISSVSSHLDVTPSLLALLKGSCGIRTRHAAHWLGHGLDTAVLPRNIHSIAFIQNNKEIIDFLDKEYLLSNGKLFRYDKDFWLRACADTHVFRIMQRRLEDFRTLNTYATKNNKLMPKEVFYMKMLDSLVIRSRDSILLNPGDTGGEFRAIYNHLPVSPAFRILKIEMAVDVFTVESDPAKSPLLVFDLYGKPGNQLIYEAFEFPTFNSGQRKPGAWRRISLTEYVTPPCMKQPEACSLKLYIWNRSLINIRFRHPDIKITGYY